MYVCTYVFIYAYKRGPEKILFTTKTADLMHEKVLREREEKEREELRRKKLTERKQR